MSKRVLKATSVSPLSAVLSSIRPIHKHESLEITGPVGDNVDNEKELIDLGFVPLEKVLIKAPDGQLECEYIKSINKFGDIVFIHLDVEGMVSASKSSPCLVETKTASVVPYSIKMSTMDCLDMDVCGVAFVCKGKEMCILDRSDNGAPTEKVFSVKKADGTDQTSFEAKYENNIIAYPIARMSEIRANPATAYASIYNGTKSIMNNAYNSCDDQFKEIVKSIKDMNDELDTFIGLKDTLVKNLGQSVLSLEKYMADYELKINKTQEEKENLRKISHNLKVRHDMVVDIVGMCQHLNGVKSDILKIKEKISTISRNAKELLSRIDYLVE